MKILLASEELTNRPREGTLVFLMHLARFLQRETELTAVHAEGEPDPGLHTARILSPKTILTRELFELLRSERFDAAVYVPRSGLTAFGLARGRILQTAAGAPVFVVGLQERPVGLAHRLVLLFGSPRRVLTPAAGARRALERAGVPCSFIMPGYDERAFRPVAPGARERLKAKYDLPRDRFILLHVGHVRESRNLEVFLRYRDWGTDVQPVIKAGDVDPSWAHRLRMAGIIVIDEYIHDVHELYQAADCYLFPVNDPTGAVEFPLSVIEACACNLPVLSTRFGLLPEMIGEGNGFHYYDRVSEIAGRLAAAREGRADTAPKVRDYSWEMVFRNHLLNHLRRLPRGDGSGKAR